MSNGTRVLIGTCADCEWWERNWSKGTDGKCEMGVRVVYGDTECGFGCIKWEMKEDTGETDE